jgi:hypothetical protein
MPSTAKLGEFGFYAVLVGAGIFVGEKFIPQLSSISGYVKWLVVGGAALWLLAKVV